MTPIRLFVTLLAGTILAGLTATQAAWAQGCCLAVRTMPAPAPRLQLDVTASPGHAAAAPSLGGPLGQAPAALPFMPSPLGNAPPAAPRMAMTFSAPLAQGDGQVSLTFGVRSVDPALAGGMALLPLR